ncbi:MAG: hypothetical protein IID50_10380, partial [Proteobacteria bacterium]|nr:hypothetical protein [Pseudomonadota bacterium]
GLPRLSDGVAHASRCPASPQRTLRAENLGKPSLWVMISDPWYKARPAGGTLAATIHRHDPEGGFVLGFPSGGSGP